MYSLFALNRPYGQLPVPTSWINYALSIVFTKQSPILREAEGHPGRYHGTEIMDENLSQAKGGQRGFSNSSHSQAGRHRGIP